ncbi:MAG: STAS domain-containing protein [bacterium]
MELSVEQTDGGVVILAVSGEIGWNTSPELHKALIPLFAENPVAIVLDLSGVSFMDSSGVATLIEGLQYSHRSEIPFRLSGMTRPIIHVLKLANLEDLFEIFDTREAALKDLT